MPTAPSATELSRLARLRRYVGVFARGGDYRAAAAALAELSRAGRASGLTVEALKRARQAAALAQLDGSAEERAESLTQLASACLEAGDLDSVVEASQMARAEAEGAAEPARARLDGTAGLLAGAAERRRGDLAAARALLDGARDRLVEAGEPRGAALALEELALCDLAEDAPERAEVCFRFAADFHRAAGAPAGAAQATALAARAFAAAGLEELAARWSDEAIAAADRAGDGTLAAWLAWERADHLERAVATEAAIEGALAAAHDAARRCARLAQADPATRALLTRTRLQLGRLVRAPEEALRHLEAAFDLGLSSRDEAALSEALEGVVGGLVAARLPAPGWTLVERFARELRAGGYPALADAASAALVELRVAD